MPAPPRRKTLAQKLDTVGDAIGRFALAVFDPQPSVPPGSKWSRTTRFGRVYPTRLNFAADLRSAFTAYKPDWTGGYGLTLRQVFADAWDYVVADAGEDEKSLDLLRELYDNIEQGEEWTGSDEQIQRAVEVLASYRDDSLWTRAVVNLFPQHPQTPGSDDWQEEEERAAEWGREAHHESDTNPWT